MTKKQIQQEFIKFLKENNVLIDFICILADKRYTTLFLKTNTYNSISLSKYLNQVDPPENYLLFFTPWEHTNEWDKWLKLDYKWFNIALNIRHNKKH